MERLSEEARKGGGHKRATVRGRSDGDQRAGGGGEEGNQREGGDSWRKV